MSKEEKKISDIGYLFFIAINSVIGGLGIYFITKNINILSKFSIFIVLFGVALFIATSFLFKNFFKNFYLSEVFLYLYFGVLTTLINISLYYVIDSKLHNINTVFDNNRIIVVAQIIAFIAAVLFAFITNKLFVFKSISFMPNVFFREMFTFFSARIITFVIETVGMLLLVNKLKLPNFISKVTISVICIVLNYIASKLIIFRKKKDDEI